MKEIPRTQILEHLKLENPWWEDQAGIPDFYQEMTPRAYLELFFPLVENRQARRAVVLTGPRRVGKTVMLHHAIKRPFWYAWCTALIGAPGVLSVPLVFWSILLILPWGPHFSGQLRWMMWTWVIWLKQPFFRNGFMTLLTNYNMQDGLGVRMIWSGWIRVKKSTVLWKSNGPTDITTGVMN